MRNETQPLLHNHLRNYTIRHSSRILVGIYNKINYLSSCYNSCWVKNGKHGSKAQQLLCFGGGFTQSGSIMATLILYVFGLLPFAAAWPFFFERSELRKKYLLGLLIFTTSVEFVLFLWHFYCICLTKSKNYETWLTSWFTFAVNKEILRNMEGSQGQGTLSLFDLEEKLRIIDVSVQDLCRLNSAFHQITVNEREKLATRIEKLKLDQAAVILYSQEFISEFIMHSLYGVFALASLSVISCSLLTWKILTVTTL